MAAHQDRADPNRKGGESGVRTRIPSDIDRADTVLYGLTARQAALVAAAGALAWGTYQGFAALLPEVLAAAGAVLIFSLGALLAFFRPDGIDSERFLVFTMAHLKSARRRVLASEGLPDLPKWARSGGRLQPLDLPPKDVSDDGLISLGKFGLAAVLRISAKNFALLCEDEQTALTEGFGRFLNSLDGLASFVVLSERIDIRVHLDAIEQTRESLPHFSLKKAAASHAEFLAALAKRPNALRRDAYLVLREQAHDSASSTLSRRVEDARGLLKPLGVSAELMSTAEVVALIERASDPRRLFDAKQVLPHETVRGKR